MRPGTIQILNATRGFGCLRDPEGAKVFFRRSALTPPASFATLEVGMRVEFEPEPGPKGPRAVTITVPPLETPPVLSFEALAAYFRRHAAG
jgi:CspA family cold shock protein